MQPKSELSEAINLDFVKFYQIFIKFVVVFTTLLFVFYIYVLYVSVNKNMQRYSIIIFCSVASCYSLVIIIFLWGPVRLFSTDIIYPAGILSPFSSRSSGLCCVIIATVYATLIDSFFATFVGTQLNPSPPFQFKARVATGPILPSARNRAGPGFFWQKLDKIF